MRLGIRILLRQTSWHLQMNGGNCDSKAAQAQFFMIGEQHGTADIANFSRALYSHLAQDGYTHMAIEVGPWSTRFAEDLMRTNPDAFVDFMSAEKTFFALPFLFFKEESDLLFDVLRSGGSTPVLWGLDQEFVGASPVLLPLLESLAKGETEKAALAIVSEAAAQSPMYIGTAEEGEFAELRHAFEARGNEEALALIDAIIISNRIYKPFTGRGGTGYAGNLERENYLKTNFLKAFAAARANDAEAPKVFFKFGATHGSRGRSGTNVPAFTNFLAEWGRAEGYSTFNIHIDCSDGTARDILSGEEPPCESYFLAEEDDNKPNLLREYIDDKSLTVIDLRGLRPWASSMPFLDEATVNLIFAYDAVLQIPNVKAASTYWGPAAKN